MTADVFITDGHWRKSLAAVRGLGIKGLRVTVGESTSLATAAFSRYCHRRVVYPSPLRKPGEFVEFLYEVVSRNAYQLLLPMEEETLGLLCRHRSEFSCKTYLPVVSHETFEFARRKDKVLQLAEAKGIPVPRTWYIEEISQLDELKGKLPYPVVIKPRKGSGAAGIAYSGNPQAFLADYLRVHRYAPFPLVQEQIPQEGPGYGASFLFDEAGRVKASFVHRRLREYPVSGGASTLRESVRRDDVRDMALTLLKGLDWFGVAMVEFKLDPRDGIPKLMEINPRFWGSLALAIACGVNFPYLLYRLSLGERFEPVEHYALGKKCRWLLPGDFLHFIHNPRRRRLLPHFFHFRDGNTAYDILSLKDPLPAMGRILTLLTLLYDRDMKTRLRSRWRR